MLKEDLSIDNISFRRTVPLKGLSQEIFCLRYFLHQKASHKPLIDRLKYLRFWFQFQGDITDFRKMPTTFSTAKCNWESNLATVLQRDSTPYCEMQRRVESIRCELQ
jgi:hypothetical protein